MFSRSEYDDDEPNYYNDPDEQAASEMFDRLSIAAALIIAVCVVVYLVAWGLGWA